MVSIVIPTYNRPECLQRLLGYYDSYRNTYNIIVADASSDEVKKLNKKTILSFPRLKVQYLDGYPEGIDLSIKELDALHHVNTRYCVICADDDFITPTGIEQSVDFLEKNPDFAVANGDYLHFGLRNDKTGKDFYWRKSYVHQSIAFPYAETRLKYHLSNCSQIDAYSVRRTDLMKRVFEEIIKSSVDRRLFGELSVTLLTLIYGKAACLDVLYGARDVIRTRSADGITLGQLLKDGLDNNEYIRFRELIAKHLIGQSQMDIQESRILIDDAMSIYLNRKFYSKRKKNIMNVVTQRLGRFLTFLSLPDWADGGIRNLYNTPANLLTKNRVPVSPSRKGYEDFEKMRLQVLVHPRTDI